MNRLQNSRNSSSTYSDFYQFNYFTVVNNRIHRIHRFKPCKFTIKKGAQTVPKHYIRDQTVATPVIRSLITIETHGVWHGNYHPCMLESCAPVIGLSTICGWYVPSTDGRNYPWYGSELLFCVVLIVPPPCTLVPTNTTSTAA